MNINSLRQSYEERIRVLQDRHQAELRIKNEQINAYQREIDYLRELSLNLSKRETRVLSNNNHQIVSNNNHQIEVRTESKSMSEANKSKYDQSGANIGNNVDQAQDGSQITGIGIQHNYPPEQKRTLAEAAEEIQQILEQLQKTYQPEDAQQQVARDLVNKAQSNSTFRSNLIKWGKSLGDTAANTTVSEAVKGVFKLALFML